MSKPSVLVLNGPNLNMLGTREPEIYGAATLGDVETLCHKTGEALGLDVTCRQSNREGQLVDWIQQAKGTAAGIVINGGAYTHSSIAILDALRAVDLPVIEVHLSNIFQREAFRATSYISLAAKGMICGLGVTGYELALRALSGLLK